MICQGTGRLPISFLGKDRGICSVCARPMQLRDDDDSMPDHHAPNIPVLIEEADPRDD